MQNKLTNNSLRPTFLNRVLKDLVKNKYIYLMALPVVIWYVVFAYVPMYGLTMAFQDFSPRQGYFASPFVGFKHFESFFNSTYFFRLLKNTFLISFYDILLGFPAPIILAILINEIQSKSYKKIVQTVSYIPHFISVVIICGILTRFTSSNGLFNDIIALFGGERSDLFTRSELFRSLFIGSGIWQGVGFGTIIYLAAISGIDVELYNASKIDGASKLKQIMYITIPSLLPTIMILLILRIGSLMSVGYEKIMLLYNPSIYETADVISTFVFRKGILDANYSYSAAIGLFNSIINFMLLMLANWFSRKTTDNSLW